MKRTSIKTILAELPFDQTLTVKGWVRTKRGGKKVSFVELNDGSTVTALQLVIDNPNFDPEQLKLVLTGACIGVSGTLVRSQGAGQAAELIVQTLEVYGTADGDTYPLQRKAHSMEFLREIAHLRPRTNLFGCVFRLRHALAFAIHEYFHRRGFVYVHTPIITGSDTEGAGEQFQVTTLPIDNPPRTPEGTVDFSQDFFGKPTHLTVSGQLNGELAALALSDIYTFGPTFRAENSNTSRHLAEFWMIEPEMAFYDLADNIELAEDFIKALVRFALTHNLEDLKYLSEKNELDLVGRLNSILEHPFERVSYTEAVAILQASGQTFEYPCTWGVDLQSEHERYLVEQHFQKPVIVYNYPKDIKAFYMRLNDDGKTVAAMDVLFPGIGEIIGGSQREERYDTLLRRIHEMNLAEEHYQWYLDTRRYGTAPHSGFGLGFERLLTFVTGMGNIRDVIPFPRTPGNAEF
jgi:asparaginyl-tRNA synthetase